MARYQPAVSRHRSASPSVDVVSRAPFRFPIVKAVKKRKPAVARSTKRTKQTRKRSASPRVDLSLYPRNDHKEAEHELDKHVKILRKTKDHNKRYHLRR